MSTSKDLEPTSLTFDDIIHTNPLLFRLHSPKYSHTYFNDDSKILVASNKWKKCKDNSEDIIPTLEDQKEKPPPYETVAVAGHITSWCEGNTERSDFISLTYNFWYVLWEWKRRRQVQRQWRQSKVSGSEDDFQVIILKSSELKGLAKLGIEVVNETTDIKAYRFTRAQKEVIVADFIRPSAILGAMSLSQLQGFIPSWCRERLESVGQVPETKEKMALGFKPFVQTLRELKKEVSTTNDSEDDGILQSLRFALELLTPILAGGEHWHQRTDNESVVGSAKRDGPRDESRTLERSSHDTTHVGGLSAGAAEDSPRVAHLPKRRKLEEPEEEQRGVQDTTEPGSAEQGGKDPERLCVCNYIRAILADIWYMEELGGRQALLQTGTDDIDKLLKRYMETIEKYVLHACRGFHS